MLANDHQYMQRAIKLAHQAQQQGEVPVGAVVVQANQVIAEGYNQPIKHHDPTAHAEIIALRAAAQQQQNYRLNGCTLYVTLEPCAMCMGAILHARIQRLVFAAWDPRAGAVRSVFQMPQEDKLNHSLIWTDGVLEAEASALLTGFFAHKRKAEYQPPSG